MSSADERIIRRLNEIYDAQAAGGAPDFAHITGDPSDNAALDAALDAKEGSLGFTPVPETRTVAGHPLSANVTLVKADVGLGNVDNTSDAGKPVSSATQTALDLKQTAAQVQALIDAAQKTILSLGNRTGTPLSAGVTNFQTFAYMGSSNAASSAVFAVAETERQAIIPIAGTLKNFVVRTADAQPGDGSVILTVRINGVDTGITITIAAGAAAGTFSDTTNTAAVVVGDLVSFSGVNASASNSALFWQWAIAIQ